MDWEDWLRKSAAPPSDHEDAKRKRTEDEIRDALRSYAALKGRPYRVYAKGSYANNTNVRLNYDVDIAVEYYGYFYSDLVFDLQGQSKDVVDVVDSDDPYERADFQRDILDALETAFGGSAITEGRIAYHVRNNKTTLPADVVPCWEYRRYERIVNGVPYYEQGAVVFPKGGARTENYSQQQLDNGVAKNLRTGRRYKRMVRALKRLQSRLVANGILDEELPSYLVECLVYNVPDGDFQHDTYKADIRAVLAHLFNETLANGAADDFVEVSELKYLFRGDRSWTISQAHEVANAAWDELGFD